MVKKVFYIFSVLCYTFCLEDFFAGMIHDKPDKNRLPLLNGAVQLKKQIAAVEWCCEVKNQEYESYGC